jgi:hypothetical protein
VLRVYCDTGGYSSKLEALASEGAIELRQFWHENRSRVRSGAFPSDLRFQDRPAYAYNDLRANQTLSQLTHDDIQASVLASKFPEISAIVGSRCRADAQHLDSAYLSNCRVFLISDFDDIVSKRDLLGPLLWLNIFLVVQEWEQFLAFIRGSDA